MAAEAPPEAATPASPGGLLAAERERQGLSRADVAQRVHMSVSQIEALETGDYGRLPRGTFLRGFVRNYAKALGMDPEAPTRLLAETAPRDPRPGIVVKSQNIRFDPIGERLSNPYVKAAVIAAVALVLGFFAMYWWLFIRPTPPAAAAKKTLVTEAVPIVPAPKPVEPAAAAPEPPKSEATPAAVAPQAVAPARGDDRVVDPIPILAAGGSIIRLRFRGNSWVEIKDGRGKVLLSRINPGGSEAEVVGKGPFSIVVGNAPDVKMFYNDREFDLEPHTRVAVARFTLN